jgi:acyl-CoA dehydrogenase
VIDRQLQRVLTASPAAVADLHAWWDATAAERAAWELPVDRALVCGARADRIGFAFAGGYAAALHALVPATVGALTALCATEEGGAHPRAIRTTLVPDGNGFRLDGTKKWGTIASEAAWLLVVASMGEDAGGKNRLRVIRVPANARGVRITPISAPFVPEIPHAEVEFVGVAVPADAVLRGDGYDDYLKPFRTVEDVHVHAALLGYLIGVARRHRLGDDVVERLCALAAATRTLALSDAKAVATHVALAGVLDLVTGVVATLEERWTTAGDEHARWQRDRALLQVAGKARAARRERAWQLVGS